MRLVARLLLTSIVVAGLPGPTATAAEDPSPSPQVSVAPEPILWLSGPFGTVPSETADAGRSAGDVIDDRPLDAFVRSAPLRLETGDPDVSIDEWRASLTALDGTTPPIEADEGTDELADGGTPSHMVALTAPDVPGTYRVEAHAALSSGSDARGAWTIVVPDRTIPADGLIEVPAPRLVLAAQGGRVDAWSGSGCHIYLCVDVGRLPPLRLVPRLDVIEGEPLSLRLSDESGIAAWKVTLYPILSRIQPAVDEVAGEPESPVDSFSMAAPVAGEWLIQAEVTYDRLRGWTHAFYRLTSS
jgi:hypothetical protein